MDICKVHVGKNDGWKQKVNIGRVNNQSFVSIPFNMFISMLDYKLRQRGILLETSNEDYTSVCSFPDLEPVQAHDVYLGRRVKRGLFRTANKQYLNADVNAAYNIGRKCNAGFLINDSIEALPLMPVKLTA